MEIRITKEFKIGIERVGITDYTFQVISIGWLRVKRWV